MSLCTDSQMFLLQLKFRMFFESSQIMLENMIIRFDTNLCSLCSLSAAAIKAKGRQIKLF